MEENLTPYKTQIKLLLCWCAALSLTNDSCITGKANILFTPYSSFFINAQMNTLSFCFVDSLQIFHKVERRKHAFIPHIQHSSTFRHTRTGRRQYFVTHSWDSLLVHFFTLHWNIARQLSTEAQVRDFESAWVFRIFSSASVSDMTCRSRL